MHLFDLREEYVLGGAHIPATQAILILALLPVVSGRQQASCLQRGCRIRKVSYHTKDLRF